MNDEESPQEPLLRIVKGDPTPEEVAALVAVVSALANARGDEGEKAAPSQWAARHRAVRPPHHAASGAWRASALPR